MGLNYVVFFIIGGSRYRCVPKIVFSATFFFISFNFLQKYRRVPKIGFSADIPSGIFIDISIGNFMAISIDISTDKEEGGRKERRKEGVGVC